MRKGDPRSRFKGSRIRHASLWLCSPLIWSFAPAGPALTRFGHEGKARQAYDENWNSVDQEQVKLQLTHFKAVKSYSQMVPVRPGTR
jgi:hypothetical protein